MIKIALLGAILAATLAGCATQEKFNAKMDGFVGQPESALVMAYGVPTGTYPLGDGTKVIQFSRSRNMVLPGATTYQPITSNTYGNVNVNRGVYGTTSGNYSQTSTVMVPQTGPAINITQSCSVNFMISSAGIVQSWKAEGNHCRSN